MPDNPRADLDRSSLPEDRKQEEECTTGVDEPQQQTHQKGNKKTQQELQSCLGCLFFSQGLYRDGRQPVCFGLKRKETDFVGYRPTRVDEVERSGSSGGRDGSVQLDFRYVCVGYSIYGDGRGTGVTGVESDRKGGPEGTVVAGGYGEAKAGAAAYLPLCSGSEILLEKRAELHPQQQQHLQKKRGEDQKNEGLIEATPDSSSTPGNLDDEDGFIVKESKRPSSRPLLPIIRPGVGVGTIPVDEFAGRFLRSAGLIAARVVTNMSKVAGAVKAGVDDIFYPDRGRSK
ncbi:hypothetical protein CBR_g12214 [Chara braunii]|uniref:DUF8204 domain-containing protein n=1 Tax=Chara braunii TaxID=69332 RepID=A0A388KRE4_CHABU|nr:hypothetical protein CBR_g12214 [Chara braunii]|eukprot:GBG72640.1 hypothetical protein CBR_g12214 [Chara braunii]